MMIGRSLRVSIIQYLKIVVLTCQLDLLTNQTKFLVRIISSPFRLKNFKKSTNYFMETLAMGLQQTGFN